MVGDSIHRDIQGAASAGLKTVWLNRNKNMCPDIKPDFKIDNLLQLIAILHSGTGNVKFK